MISERGEGSERGELLKGKGFQRVKRMLQPSPLEPYELELSERETYEYWKLRHNVTTVPRFIQGFELTLLAKAQAQALCWKDREGCGRAHTRVTCWNAV